MKKTRRILSIVLSVALAFASLPMVYTATAASDIVLHNAETGTLENPTRPVISEGVIEKSDIYKMNFNSQNTSYTFYQTVDNEYFIFGQTSGVQHYNGDYKAGNRTLTLQSISFFTGESDMGGITDQIDVEAGSGRWEIPLITTNPTEEFLSKYYVSNTWYPSNSNAEGVGSVPFVLQGANTDLAGCRVYTFNNDIVFRGNSATESGEINTGYYQQLKWDWSSSDASAKFDLRIGTTLRVLDARVLAEEIAKAEGILANPDNYTKEYISSVEATLNTIPETLRDFTEVYSQEEIDEYAQMLQDVSLNSADYTEYNEVYNALNNLANDNNTYSAESFASFKATIAEININLPKNLDKTKQATVDAATQALIDAYNSLVVTGSSDGSSNTVNVNKTDFAVENSFKFIQIKDDQKFSFTQKWVIQRTGGDKLSARKFYSDLVRTDSKGGSVEFLSKLDSSSILTNQTVSTKAVKNGLSGATIFKCWSETDSNGVINTSSSAINYAEGVINPDYGGFKDDNVYYLQTSPVFVGLSAEQSGEKTYTFDQNIYASYSTWVGEIYTYDSGSFTTTLTITDARALIDAVNGANAVIANPGTHSTEYIEALKAAVSAVPSDLLHGTKYYTQSEVDKLCGDINNLLEGEVSNLADYSEFTEVFQKMISENENKYTEESYSVFIEEIYSINAGLNKNLTADSQATVDAAVEALYNAHDKLVSRHLDDDQAFTSNDIGEAGNSPLEFSVKSNEYRFMQVADGQKFAVRTELTVRNTRSRYKCNLLSLGFSTVSADTVSTICDARATPDEGCHNGENVIVNNSQTIVNAVTGLNVYETANDAGDIAEHNTWVNTEGTALSTDGVLNEITRVSSTASSAYAEMYYVGATGNQESNSGQVDFSYALRLGWSYLETVLGIDGSTVRRHAHIPVNIKITDARALNTLYGHVDDIIKGQAESSYTYNSLINLYNAYKGIPEDMAYGDAYYTQEQVNEKYAQLKEAYDLLQVGADYSEYLKAYIQADEIIKQGNADSKGNARYDEAAYTEFVSAVTAIDGALSKDLGATAENQAAIDQATAQLNEALATLETNKRADYSKLNDAMTKAEQILGAPEGTYTEETLTVLREVYNNAVALDKTLPASQQSSVDALASALNSAVADIEYKADYSQYENAKTDADSVTNADGKYEESAYQQYLDKIAEIDSTLNKDLPDTAENRVIIEEAAQALEAARAELENNKYADYTEFDDAKKALEDIVNNPDSYTDETVEAAQKALDDANKIPSGMVVGENNENQQTIDSATDNMKSVADSAQKKANYTEFDNAYSQIEEILNNPDKYTQETVDAAQNAKDQADAVGKNQPESNQSAVNSATGVMRDVINGKVEKADYTEYNSEKSKADALVNDDGNGNKLYDEEAFNTFKETVSNIDTSLDKNLPATEQSKVESAVESLKQAQELLEQSRFYTVTFTDMSGLTLDSFSVLTGTAFGDIPNIPTLPDGTETLAVIGWANGNTLMLADTAITEDITVTVAYEFKKLLPTDVSTVTIDEETGYVTGIDKNTTAEDLKAQLQNDETVVEIKDYTGAELSNESFVGTGSTITLKSKYTSVVYETKTVIIYGDVDGDGDVDNDDYSKSVKASLGNPTTVYTVEGIYREYFFLANDVANDGYIDVLDASIIALIKNGKRTVISL